MQKLSFLLSLCFLMANIAAAQNCNCETNFAWVKKTFEENDAGFQYALDIKGKTAYEAHNKVFLQKIKNTRQISDCTKQLYAWLTFFRAGHIAIKGLQSNPASVSPPVVKENAKWETVNISSREMEKYLNTKTEPGYEGIWETPPYKIGIKKIGQQHVGFIIETSAENWKPGDVKLKFNDKTGTFYLRDKSAEPFTKITLVGKNHLEIGRFLLKRLYPVYETEESIKRHFRLITAGKPFIENINASTLLLRIPSFDNNQKKDIDSVILANRSRILETENLIIDLRNNGGGSDISYKEILPFLYTNPIRVVGVQLLSTKLNNQRMIDFVNNPEYGFDDAEKKWAQASYDTLQKHIGSFVNLDTTIVSVEKLDSIYAYPKNVGIIIHKGNGSTTEQFLLAAKQSKKVKLFGTTTFGVLDISNMHFVKSPCNEFELGYSLSKSFRIPDMTIDSKGIQPDYLIDSKIKDHEWLEYVMNILNEH